MQDILDHLPTRVKQLHTIIGIYERYTIPDLSGMPQAVRVFVVEERVAICSAWLPERTSYTATVYVNTEPLGKINPIHGKTSPQDRSISQVDASG